MAKTCNKDGCDYPVFGKGFCKSHQYLRTDKKKKNVTKKRTYINPISKKRKGDNEKYFEVKTLKKKALIECNEWRCFFSESIIDSDQIPEWHHLCGKEGSLLYEYDNIFPAERRYHTAYHHWDIGKLLKERWYMDFLVKIEELSKSSETMKCVFDKETRRIEKMFK